MSMDDLIPKVDVPEDVYHEDPNYDVANDAIDPNTMGEDDAEGTPGAAGAPVGDVE